MVVADHSSVAAGGIASFHASSIAVGLQVDDRLCGSLSRLGDIVSLGFRLGITSGYPSVLTHSPLHSAVWTFLPSAFVLGSSVRIPKYSAIIPYF